MSGFYSIVVPLGTATRNEWNNPSFELGTAGCGTISGGTVGTTSNTQAFGVMSGSVAPGANGTSGFLGPIFTAANGSAYAYSFYGSFPVGSAFRAGIGDSNGNSLQGSFIGTGGGTWHRYAGSFTEASGASRRLAVRKNGNTATDAFYLDALQVELGSLTTYIDGDQGEGYFWDGFPNISSSVRDASVRTGGTVIALGDLGFLVMEHDGVGMPDVEVVTQDYAIVPGAFYQRTHTQMRSFLLTGLMSGTTFQGLHALRQQVVNTIRPNLTTEPQPFRILYTGAGGSVFIDGIYDNGLQTRTPTGFSETAAIRFVAPNPYWQTITERGTTLSPMVNMGSTNWIVFRNPVGQWGTLGIAGTTINNIGVGGLAAYSVHALLVNSGGTLFVGGDFGTAGGTQARFLAQYVNGAWGTLAGGTINATVAALAERPDGAIIIGGNFSVISGTANQQRVALWNGAFGTLNGGTVNSLVEVIRRGVGGTFFFGGLFGTAGGTVCNGVAYHNGQNWGTLVNGIPALVGGTPFITALLIANNRALYIGGTFTSINGTATNNIGFWNGVGAGTLGSAGITLDSASNVSALTQAPDGVIYAGASTVPTNYGGITNIGMVGAWNGQQWGRLGSGVLGAAPSSIRALQALPNGLIAVAGSFGTVNGQTDTTRNFAYWNTTTFIPTDIILPGGQLNALTTTREGGLYVGGSFTGTAIAAAVTPIVNPGNADTPARFVFRGPSSGTARLYQVSNNTLNTPVYLTTRIQAQEVQTLTFNQEQSSYVDDTGANIYNFIIPSSVPAQWRLGGGTNQISVFADNPSLRVDLIWRPRLWSSDGTLT